MSERTKIAGPWFVIVGPVVEDYARNDMKKRMSVISVDEDDCPLDEQSAFAVARQQALLYPAAPVYVASAIAKVEVPVRFTPTTLTVPEVEDEADGG